MNPDNWRCDGCPSWNEENGCMEDIEDVSKCKKIGEDGTYTEDCFELEGDLEEYY